MKAIIGVFLRIKFDDTKSVWANDKKNTLPPGQNLHVLYLCREKCFTQALPPAALPRFIWDRPFTINVIYVTNKSIKISLQYLCLTSSNPPALQTAV